MSNRLGLFIHWGIYSLLGVHEQVQARGDVPREEYEALAKRFDPVRYDPEAWVKMAKDAGMSYFCFTAKHHDGFCMWDTAQTDFSIMHTPYGKDVLAMLADACRKYGVKLSIYYSLPDWHHENAYNPLSSHQWKAKAPEKADREAYISFVKAQVTELLTNYGEIYTFFWDIPPGFMDRSVNELVRKLQPGILINNRGYDEGDFATPERSVPDGQRFGKLTEACQSVGEQSWGYRTNEDYFSARCLMESVDKIMAMNGSYLLNVGPKPDGTIPAEAERIVRRIGGWYGRVRESLEACEEEPLPLKLSSGPYIAVRKGGKTYLHFWKGLNSSAVTFTEPPFPEEPERLPKNACLLNTGAPLTVRFGTLPMRNDADAVARKKFLSLADIPVDDCGVEPVVLEIEW